MFEQLINFSESLNHTDMMMRPGMVTKVKSPEGWLDMGGTAFSENDEKELITFGEQMTGDPKWMDAMKKTRHSQDFVFEFDGTNGVRLRCKIALSNNGRSYTVNMRKIPNSIIPLEKTGLPSSVQKLVNQGKGLIIVTGPTGAGKTTTLAAMVDFINRFKKQHIVTLERPIEYIHTNNQSVITQRDVPVDVDTFAEGLHDALRQSINTIMIGEVMDKATVDTMLMAAETGHLVLATMHTPSAKDTVMRLASFYGADEAKQKMSVISSVLNGVIGQTLLPTADKSGWKLGYELMINTPVIANAIYNGDMKALGTQLENASKDPRDEMCLMNEVLAKMVKEKSITMDAAMHATYDPVDLRKRAG